MRECELEEGACTRRVKAVEKGDKLKRPLSGYFMWLNDSGQLYVAEAALVASKPKVLDGLHVAHPHVADAHEDDSA